MLHSSGDFYAGQVGFSALCAGPGILLNKTHQDNTGHQGAVITGAANGLLGAVHGTLEGWLCHSFSSVSSARVGRPAGAPSHCAKGLGLGKGGWTTTDQKHLLSPVC